MFWKKTKDVKVGSGSSGLMDKVAHWMLALQRTIADWLNGVVARLPVKKIKFALLVFCLLACGLSGHLMIVGIVGEKKVAPALNIEQTSVPKYYDHAGDPLVREGRLDGHTYEQILSMRASLDSLAIHHPKTVDSLLLWRPGLIDTVRALEEIYLTK